MLKLQEATNTPKHETKRAPFKRSINKKVFSGIKQYNNSVSNEPEETPYYNLSDISTTESDSDTPYLNNVNVEDYDTLPQNREYSNLCIYTYKGVQVKDKPLYYMSGVYGKYGVYPPNKTDTLNYKYFNGFYVPKKNYKHFKQNIRKCPNYWKLKQCYFKHLTPRCIF